MKFKWLIGTVLAVIFMFSYAMAATIGNYFAPNARKTINLTVNQILKNFTQTQSYAVYSPVACKFKVQSTATIVGISNTIPATTWVIRDVNNKSPFVTFSGCTGGELQAQ